MAIASVGSLGTGNSISSGTTLTITTALSLAAGDAVVIIIGKDNIQTTDDFTSEVSSISDTSGNTWTKCAEYCNGQTAAAAGAVVSVWMSNITVDLASSSTITITFSAAITSKAATAWKYTKTAGSTLVIGSRVRSRVGDAGGVGSVDIAGLPSKEYLFVRGVGAEHDNLTPTATANFTMFTDAEADTGTSGTSMCAWGEFRILTGTSATSTPGGTPNSDHVGVMFALMEWDGVSPYIVQIDSLGTGNSITSDTTLTLTTQDDMPLAVGDAAVIIIAKNNIQTTDGETSEVSSVTDPSGNVWAKFGEYCIGKGGAGSGAVVSVWVSNITVALAVSSTITITFSAAIVAKAATAFKYAKAAGFNLALAGTLQVIAGDGIDPPSMAISGLASKEYLFVRGIAVEHGTTGFTVTTGYNAFTQALADTGGPATTDMIASGEFRIFTGTGSTSDPDTTDADNANVFFALQMVSTFLPYQPQYLRAPIMAH